jgi:hypothetical protein
MKVCHRIGLMLAGVFMQNLAFAQGVSSFGIAVLPDTQFYSRYATPAEGNQFMERYGSEPYTSQTSWLVQNSKKYNIPFVVHVGDVVDQQSKIPQWKVASKAMKILEDGGVNYSILAGNHDVTYGCSYWGSQTDCTDEQRTSNDNYLKYFPTSRAQKQSTFGGRSPNGWHEYHIFTAEGQQYLVLALSWRASNSAIAWARQVIKDHPTLPVILTSHEFLAIQSDGVNVVETDYSNFLWDQLIKDNDQIFMVVCGHNHGAGHKARINSYGHPVWEMVVDYQMAYQGGNAQMQVYEFDLTNNKINGLSFSPWVPEKPESTVTQFDRALLSGNGNDFSVDMDFEERFKGFNSSFIAGSTNYHTSIVEELRNDIAESFTEPSEPVILTPLDRDDYAHSGNTLAHWKFDTGTVGTPVVNGADKYAVPDQTGRNPLHFEGKAGDIMWAADHHAYSASNGSVCFVTNDKTKPNPAFFFTDGKGPLSNEQFKNSGYTVEAFVKIAKDWTPANGAWMNILTRDMPRGWIGGYKGGDGGESSLLFAVSSLREFQWEPTTFLSSGVAEKTNWSGEVMADTWEHVAIVNDPVTHDTTMYVAGAPVLRNVKSAVGIAGLNWATWVVGAGQYGGWQGGHVNGFRGCINEIRITNAALTPDQWLTARKNRITPAGSRQVVNATNNDDEIIVTGGSMFTGGNGHNTYVLRSIRDAGATVTDFIVGRDKLNLIQLLKTVGYKGSDPIADGYVRAVNQGGDTIIQVDTDGASRPTAFRTLITLKATTANKIDKNSFYF